MTVPGVLDDQALRRYRELLDAEDAAFDELEHAYEEGDRVHFEADLDAWRSAPAAPIGPGPTPDEAGLDRVRARLDDDLDTPGALAALDGEAAAGRPVVRGAALLGITL